MRHIAAEEGQETTGQSGEPGSGKHTGGAHTLSSGRKRFPRGGLRDSQTRREYRVGQGVRKVKQAENVQSSREEECLGQRVYVLGRGDISRNGTCPGNFPHLTLLSSCGWTNNKNGTRLTRKRNKFNWCSWRCHRNRT